MTDHAEFIAKTWEECGVKSVRPLRSQVFVRTELLPEKIGSIYLPPNMRTNYHGLVAIFVFFGRVLSVGPKVKCLKPGDRIAFPRLYFAHWQKMEDGTLVGWLPEENITGIADEVIVESDNRAGTQAAE
jgi:hypothetical protein